jgi:REP element-mobilizing transposase RayT
VRFDDRQIAAVANGIGRIISDFGLPCFAAAILHSHVHMVIRRQNHLAEEWVGYFKRSASRVLRQTGLHPFADAVGNDARLPSPWADGGWKVFLHTHEDVQRAIRYVEDNPVRDGMPPQRWKWVVAYEPSRGRDG